MRLKSREDPQGDLQGGEKATGLSCKEHGDHQPAVGQIQLKYFYVIQTLYALQKEMYCKGIHTVKHRTESIHQPHERPTVRGKGQAKVEFGAKINVSAIDGISFVDKPGREAFNEGCGLKKQMKEFCRRFGCYPRELLADQIYSA